MSRNPLITIQFLISGKNPISPALQIWSADEKVRNFFNELTNFLECVFVDSKATLVLQGSHQPVKFSSLTEWQEQSFYSMICMRAKKYEQWGVEHSTFWGEGNLLS